MAINAVTTKIISTLGNKESLIPIMIKDGVDSTSLTIKSFKEGGSVEGIDRGIDEFGTQAIWIGGIPLFKKIFEKSIYKIAKINPDVDPRIIANKEYSQWAKENAKGLMSNSKTQTVKEAITDCLSNDGETAKNLFKGKIITATALTLASFFLMTKIKQKNTKNTVINEMKTNIQDNNENKCSTDNNIFSDFSFQKGNNLSFKGILKNVSEAIMFNPVHNMKIIDAGITAERIGCSRNKTEFLEHTIKEGGFLFFLYGFGGLIEKGINKFSSSVLDKPINLDINILMDKTFEKALASKRQIPSDLEKAKLSGESLTQKLNFIIKNPDNILVQAAKKSKIISTTKDINGKSVIDTSKYIDINEFNELQKNIKEINEKFLQSNETAATFLNKTKALKVTSVLANIGVSCLFLAYLIPKAVYKYREIKTGSTKFHVAEDIKKQNKEY